MLLSNDTNDTNDNSQSFIESITTTKKSYSKDQGDSSGSVQLGDYPQDNQERTENEREK